MLNVEQKQDLHDMAVDLFDAYEREMGNAENTVFASYNLGMATEAAGFHDQFVKYALKVGAAENELREIILGAYSSGDEVMSRVQNELVIKVTRCVMLDVAKETMKAQKAVQDIGEALQSTLQQVDSIKKELNKLVLELVTAKSVYGVNPDKVRQDGSSGPNFNRLKRVYEDLAAFIQKHKISDELLTQALGNAYAFGPSMAPDAKEELEISIEDIQRVVGGELVSKVVGDEKKSALSFHEVRQPVKALSAPRAQTTSFLHLVVASAARGDGVQLPPIQEISGMEKINFEEQPADYQLEELRKGAYRYDSEGRLMKVSMQSDSVGESAMNARYDEKYNFEKQSNAEQLEALRTGGMYYTEGQNLQIVVQPNKRNFVSF